MRVTRFLPPVKCRHISVSIPTHYPNGLKMVNCNTPRLSAVTTDISYPHQDKKNFKRKNTFTPEYLLSNNPTIFKDKLHFYKPDIPHMLLSKTLDQASISKEEDSNPFWMPHLQETYQKLWSPIETDCVDLGSNCSNTFLKNSMCPLKCCQIKMSKSLQLNSQTTSCRSLQFSQPDTTAQESTVVLCKKIRIYPNLEQVKLFRKCIGASRFFFNKTSKLIESVGVKNLKLTRVAIRPKVMTSDSELKDDDPLAWQKEVPYDTRQEAIADAITSYKSALTNLKRGHISHFSTPLRSRKNTTQVFKVNKDALNPKNLTIFTQRLKKKHSKLRMRKRDIAKFLSDDTLDGNFTISRVEPGHWYIHLPRTMEKPKCDDAVLESTFLDPGTRTFQTFYSPDGFVGKIESSQLELNALAQRHDKLWGLSSNGIVSSKTKKHIRSRCAKLRKKLSDKVNDMHWQTCAFLCSTFQNIFLPEFKVAEMVSGSPLGSKTTRAMLQLSHGKFRERIKYYAQKTGRNLYIVKEHFTTKTCGACGKLNDVGGSKVYTCQSCGYKCDRDEHAARNICLKLVTKFM